MAFTLLMFLFGVLLWFILTIAISPALKIIYELAKIEYKKFNEEIEEIIDEKKNEQ